MPRQLLRAANFLAELHRLNPQLLKNLLANPSLVDEMDLETESKRFVIQSNTTKDTGGVKEGIVILLNKISGTNTEKIGFWGTDLSLPDPTPQASP